MSDEWTLIKGDPGTPGIEVTGVSVKDTATGPDPDYSAIFEDYDEESFAFEITRDKDDDLTFSMDALTKVTKGMLAFLLARTHKHWKQTGRPARHARILVVVKIDE